ncbi:hypothetical protein ACFYKX_26615 [Cytobacillus sp. FJAT-54145]|uniref:Uncharacterized protein n=1 Tax=Cytobacillus spartinae TaxID=3299023 RepID=A0ABW6KMT1_9BACI
MRVNIQIHYNIEGSRGLTRGEFNLREQDIPKFAYDWIERIKRETGYRKTIIEKVIVDNDKDIKEEVMKIGDIISEDNLPF